MPTKVKRPERRVYELLCSHGQLSARDVAKKLGLDRDVAHDLITRLWWQGKVLHSTEGAAWTPTIQF